MSDAIDRYVQESNKQIGRTKTQVLKSIKTFYIAVKHCDAITRADIVEFAQEKRNGGVEPYHPARRRDRGGVATMPCVTGFMRVYARGGRDFGNSA